MTESTRPCHVVETNCLAPPAMTFSTRATCFRCREPVCVNCSRRRAYARYGVRRLCNHCIEDIASEMKR